MTPMALLLLASWIALPMASAGWFGPRKELPSGDAASLRKMMETGRFHAVDQSTLPFWSDFAWDLETRRERMCSECMAYLLKLKRESLPPGVRLFQPPTEHNAARAAVFPTKGHPGWRRWSNSKEYATYQELRYVQLHEWYYDVGNGPTHFDTASLAYRCGQLLAAPWDMSERCYFFDFDPSLRHMYDPDDRILVIRAAPPVHDDEDRPQSSQNSNQLSLGPQATDLEFHWPQRIKDVAGDVFNSAKSAFAGKRVGPAMSRSLRFGI